MSDQFWLTKAQLKRIEPFFPRTRGIPRVDDRRVVSGIVHVIRNGLRWRDAPAVYGPREKRDWHEANQPLLSYQGLAAVGGIGATLGATLRIFRVSLQHRVPVFCGAGLPR